MTETPQSGSGEFPETRNLQNDSENRMTAGEPGKTLRGGHVERDAGDNILLIKTRREVVASRHPIV